MRLALASAAFLLLPLASRGTAPAEDAPAAKAGIAALAWLEGQWRSEDGGDVWEACYSGTEGGEIVSATKKIENGKVTLFDFERFREEDGKVLLTPFPHGKASVDFTLIGFDPKVKRAIFSNPEHDFPQRIRYEIGPDGRLKILLAAERDGKHVGFKLDLRKKT
jgi:hypothetical protein